MAVHEVSPPLFCSAWIAINTLLYTQTGFVLKILEIIKSNSSLDINTELSLQLIGAEYV